MINSDAVCRALERLAELMKENRELLCTLDAQAGDGDLGIYMERGFQKALETAKNAASDAPGEVLEECGEVFAQEAPSTLGTLIAVGMRTFGKKLSENGAEDISSDGFVAAFETACEKIQKRGKAFRGEKTILDSLFPALDAMKAALNERASLKRVLSCGYDGACQGLLDSIQMKAVHGRAAYFGDKTVGLQDGGATVGMLLLKGMYESVD